MLDTTRPHGLVAHQACSGCRPCRLNRLHTVVAASLAELLSKVQQQVLYVGVWHSAVAGLHGAAGTGLFIRLRMPARSTSEQLPDVLGSQACCHECAPQLPRV